jgi:putative ABC transport system substrate-binding protein
MIGGGTWEGAPMPGMRRREFITLLGGAAAWPLAARAQQPERMRRIGVLMSSAANDREAPARIASFLGGLQQLGWIEGRNIRIDIRWAAGDLDFNSKKYAAELVALAPDVLLATAGPTVAALQAETRTVPIVFAHAVDPVGAGFVASLARPNSNATGFILFEFSIGAKWLELLKRLPPTLCEWQFFVILHRRLGSASSRPFKPWLRHSG